MVVLAQLVEHRIVVPSVVGSSPTFHPKGGAGWLSLRVYGYLASIKTLVEILAEEDDDSEHGDRDI